MDGFPLLSKTAEKGAETVNGEKKQVKYLYGKLANYFLQKYMSS